jgi:hypothetical protein
MRDRKCTNGGEPVTNTMSVLKIFLEASSLFTHALCYFRCAVSSSTGCRKASDVWSVCYEGNGWVSLEVDIISNLVGTCVKCEAFILVNNKTEQRHEVLAAVLKVRVFWDITPLWLVKKLQTFSNKVAPSSSVRQPKKLDHGMKAPWSSEML